MRSVLLINPNSSALTTAMMVAVARAASPPRLAMITDAAALADAAEQVFQFGRAPGGLDAVVVAAFGDPGVARLRGVLSHSGDRGSVRPQCARRPRLAGGSALLPPRRV